MKFGVLPLNAVILSALIFPPSTVSVDFWSSFIPEFAEVIRSEPPSRISVFPFESVSTYPEAEFVRDFAIVYVAPFETVWICEIE